jgi:hypothetical protein
MAKKRKRTPEEWEAFKKRDEEMKQMLRDRIAYHTAKLEEERRLGLR